MKKSILIPLLLAGFVCSAQVPLSVLTDSAKYLNPVGSIKVKVFFDREITSSYLDVQVKFYNLDNSSMIDYGIQRMYRTYLPMIQPKAVDIFVKNKMLPGNYVVLVTYQSKSALSDTIRIGNISQTLGLFDAFITGVSPGAVCVYNISGVIVYQGPKEDMSLLTGIYIVYDGISKRKISIQ